MVVAVGRVVPGVVEMGVSVGRVATLAQAGWEPEKVGTAVEQTVGVGMAVMEVMDAEEEEEGILGELVELMGEVVAMMGTRSGGLEGSVAEEMEVDSWAEVAALVMAAVRVVGVDVAVLEGGAVVVVRVAARCGSMKRLLWWPAGCNWSPTGSYSP